MREFCSIIAKKLGEKEEVLMKLKPKMLLGIGIPLVAAFLIVGFVISSMASSALSEEKHV